MSQEYQTQNPQLFIQKANSLEVNNCATESSQDPSQEFSLYKEDFSCSTVQENDEYNQYVKHNNFQYYEIQQQQQLPHIPPVIQVADSCIQYPQQQDSTQFPTTDYTCQHSHESYSQIENQSNQEQIQQLQDPFYMNNYQLIITDSGQVNPPQSINQNQLNVPYQEQKQYPLFEQQGQDQLLYQFQQYQPFQEQQQFEHYENQQQQQYPQYQNYQYQQQQLQEFQYQQYEQEQSQQLQQQQWGLQQSQQLYGQYQYNNQNHYFQNLIPQQQQYQEQQINNNQDYACIAEKFTHRKLDKNQQTQKNLKIKKIKKEQKEKPYNDLKDKVRIRKLITEKKVANMDEKKPVKPKKPQDFTHFHNQFKILLTKLVPYLIDKFNENKNLDNETKQIYKSVILPFKTKIKKEDVYFLINKYDELTKEQYDTLVKKCNESTQLMKDAKFDPQLRAFLQIKNFITQQYQNETLTYDCFTTATKFINELNSYNRSYLFIFCNSDYYPKIFSTKANKLDQLYVSNYLKFALLNPSIME
ncbi:hypothetical protein ABPG74_022666 [Tetrahymena malaccensis]